MCVAHKTPKIEERCEGFICEGSALTNKTPEHARDFIDYFLLFIFYVNILTMGLVEFFEQPAVKLGVKLLIVTLLLVIVYGLYVKRERMHALSYSAGAGQRSMMQEFSGTNQRPYTTGYNDQILEAFPFPDTPKSQIELEEKNEHFRGRREHAVPASQTSEEILAAQLYREHFDSPDALVKSEIQTARSYSA